LRRGTTTRSGHRYDRRAARQLAGATLGARIVCGPVVSDRRSAGWSVAVDVFGTRTWVVSHAAVRCGPCGRDGPDVPDTLVELLEMLQLDE
jgi:hypothetical protein